MKHFDKWFYVAVVIAVVAHTALGKGKLDLTPVNTLSDKNIACETKDGKEGTCVFYYLCVNGRIVEDGSNIIDIRRPRQCPNYLEVCCEKSQLEFKNSFDGGTSVVFNEPTLSQSQFDNKTTTSVNVADSLQPTGISRCGYRDSSLAAFANSNAKDRIYADYGEFPWMVAILKMRNTSTTWVQDDYLGGGSIIHPLVVLTVAHKFENNQGDLKCRAGEWDTQTTQEKYPHQERPVADVTTHPQYFRTSLYYDVALLTLKTPFSFANAPHIGVACLGRVLPDPGVVCYTMGWGTREYSKSDFVHILKKVKLRLVDPDTCKNKLGNYRFGPYYRVHVSLTCASGGKDDACQGDGGSPLVCPDSSGNRQILYGMVAYGAQCKVEGLPGVYVNGPHVRDWIAKTIEDKGFNPLEDDVQ